MMELTKKNFKVEHKLRKITIENVEFCDEDASTKIKKNVYLHSFEMDDCLMESMFDYDENRTMTLVQLSLIITRDNGKPPYAIDMEFFVDIIGVNINREKFECNYDLIYDKMYLAVEDSVKTGFLKNVLMVAQATQQMICLNRRRNL